MSEFTKRPAFYIGGRRTFLLGANYWSRGGGPRMWERFDEAQVRAELVQMRDIGLNTCRSFAFIPSFMPEPGKISDQATGHLSRFLDLCEETNIWTIPSFLVGHMSGQNYDFPDQRGRSPYTDDELLRWQGQLIEAIGSRGAECPAVIAYLASNEMPLWGGPSDPETIRAWVARLRAALAEVDAARPFGAGDGVMNIDGGNNGFDVAALRDSVDFVGPHTYYCDTDSLRQALNAEFCLRFLSWLDKPLLLEEFGCSTAHASEENQAHYYREALHACLTTGASGALAWCYSDFDLVDEAPYRHHAFELGFGVTRADGSEKPVCDELRRFAGLVEQVDFSTLQTPVPRTAIIVPSYFNSSYPFSWEDRARMRRTLLQAYVLCVSAGIEAELVPETANLGKYALILAPSTQKLLGPTWRTLVQEAGRGATVYWSYFGGDHDFQPGPWCHNFAELTGCVHRLRFALPELPPDELFIDGAGVQLALRTDVGGPFPRSMVPVDLAPGTDQLCSDQLGRPALTRARRGNGQVVLATYPIEYYLAEQPEVNARRPAHHIYRLLARLADVGAEIDCDQAAVQRRVVRSADGELLWLINHAWHELSVGIDTPGGQPVHGAEQPLIEGWQRLSLGPKQVAVYKLDPV